MGSRYDKFSRNAPNERERAGLLLTSIAALLLVLSGSEALAEDEPAARAPLPPLPLSVPASAGERQIGDPAAPRNRAAPDRPTITLDRPRLQLVQKKPRPHSAPHRSAASAERRSSSVQSGNAFATVDPHRHRHRTVVSGKKQRQDRLSAGPAIGELAPPTGIGGTIPEERRSAAPSYDPGQFAGPPAYGYAPSYPFAWAPAEPMMFR